MSPFEFSAVMDETPPLQSPLCSLGQSLLHRERSCRLFNLAAWVSSLLALSAPHTVQLVERKLVEKYLQPHIGPCESGVG